MQPIVQWLFNTPLGQTIVTWTIIILSCIVAALIVMYFWIMIKGGIPSWALYVKGGSRFARLYKCNDSDTAIEIGQARFLKPVHPVLSPEGEPMLDEHGKKMYEETNPPITFWKRLKAAKLYLVAEGKPQTLNWKQLIEGLPQPQLSPEQLKKDPQVSAVSAAVKVFGKGGFGNWTVFILVLMAMAIGFFMAYAFVGSGLLPVG
jgi:hypothetical protein